MQKIRDILQGHIHFLDLSPPKNLGFGDIAIPIARDAKEKGISLSEFAESISQTLQVALPGVQVSVVGPFVNIQFERSEFARLVLEDIERKDYAKSSPKSRVLVEFSQPNTHKEFHIGHLRNACLGDALVRTLRLFGHDVIAVNYFGDIGTHVAKCLWAWHEAGRPELKNQSATKFFGEFYRHAYAAYEENDSVKKAVGEILEQIESRKEPWFGWWLSTRNACLEDFRSIYKNMNIHFDFDFFESDCDQLAQGLVDEYLKKGVFSFSQGAVICDLEDVGLGVCLVRKSDGTTLYATKDLALAKLKLEKFQFDESIYVVGSEQNLHFKQVFEVLKRMGFPEAEKCYHLSYQLVMLPEGKMSSRAGNAITLQSVYDHVESKVEKEFLARGTIPKPGVGRKIILAALKYGMVKQDPSKKIIFCLEDWLKFEGDTGPYILYSYARCRSILRKNAVENSDGEKSFCKLVTDTERELLHALWQFERSLEKAVQLRSVALIADQLFKICKAFNRFYLLCPVAGESEEIRFSRLRLLKAFDRVVRLAAHCLNLELVEEM